MEKHREFKLPPSPILELKHRARAIQRRMAMRELGELTLACQAELDGVRSAIIWNRRIYGTPAERMARVDYLLDVIERK